ncbi:MAG: HEPN domain-containing protein [Chloroflexi bacterium]|nr:HEPN domain-containing protein [Chloroflexota bacterium]
MEQAKVEEICSWVKKAQHDIESAEWLLLRPEPLCNAAGFHCQQAAEKMLKAYLTWRDEPFGRTHSLVALVANCLKYDRTFDALRFAATTLTPYAVALRYPGDLPDLTEKEAREALTLSQEIRDFVLARIPKPIQAACES